MQARAPEKTADMTAEMVRVEDVAKAFGGTRAVDGVSFSLAQGEFLTIVGPSGCGKTTLLRMIAGFERPDAGTIAIHGESVAKVPPHRRSVGMVFQRLALFPHMDATQNVAYPLKMRGFDRSEIAERVASTLALVRLEGFGERRPHELSGGQQQRVAIARALSYGPDLLLLDEPLSALDRKLREDMQLEFRRIQQDLGVTTINVTHDQREALVMSDHILVMRDGRVEQAASPQTIYAAPQTRFVAAFLGVTAMFRASVLRTEGDLVMLQAEGTTLRARSPGGLMPGEEVECALRAEKVAILSNDGAAENQVEGTVSQKVFEGDRTIYAVDVPELGNATLFALARDDGPDQERAVGSTVLLGFASRDLFAFPTHSRSNDKNEEQEP